MSISLGTLVVDLIAKTGNFVEGMTKAERQARQTASGIQSSFSKLGSVISSGLAPLGEVGQQIGAALGSISTGAGSAVSALSKIGGLSVATALGGIAVAGVAAAGAMAALAIKGSEVTEQLERISQKTGISIPQLQGLEAAGASVGVSLEDILTATRKFSQAIDGSGKGSVVLTATLKGLGVTSKDAHEALLQLADAFAKMPDGAHKSALAVELLGRSGLNLIPLLDKGRAGIESFDEIVQEFGPHITGGAIEATDGWKKSTLELDESWKSVEVTLTENVLPIVNKITDALAVAIVGWTNFAKQIPSIAASIGTLGGSNLGKAVSDRLDPKLQAPGITLSDRSNLMASAQAQAVTQRAVEGQKKSYEDLYDLIKSGSAEQLRLDTLKESLATAVANQEWKQAASLEQQIKASEATLAAEQKRLSVLLELNKAAEKQNVSAGNIKRSKLELPTVEVPKLNLGPSQEDIEANNSFAASMDRAKAETDAAQQSVSDFWKNYPVDAKTAVDQINSNYDTAYANFYDLLAKQEISQSQFNSISIQLEKDRQSALDDVRAHSGTQAQKFFEDIHSDSKHFVKDFYEDMSSTLKDLNAQISAFALTGRANFKGVATSLSENIVRSGLGKLESFAAGKLGGALGGKRDGNSSGSALFVTFAGVAGIAGTATLNHPFAGLGGPLDNTVLSKPDGSTQNPFNITTTDTPGTGILSGLAGGSASSALGMGGKLLSGLSKSFSGGLGSILGAFGGFLADGGDMTPGKAYITGERGPELIVPRAAGTVVPNHALASTGKGTTIHMGVSFVGVKDHDSFKANETQILGRIQNAVGRAASRR
jgi:hypothetical protein